MTYLRRSRVLRFLVVPLMIAVFLPACHKWSPVSGPLDQAISTERPDLVRVTHHDGTVTDVRSPTIQGDSLIGLPAHGPQPVPGAIITVDTVRVALSDIQGVHEQKSDGLATGAVILGGIFVGLAVAAAATLDFEPGLSFAE